MISYYFLTRGFAFARFVQERRKTRANALYVWDCRLHKHKKSDVSTFPRYAQNCVWRILFSPVNCANCTTDFLRHAQLSQVQYSTLVQFYVTFSDILDKCRKTSCFWDRLGLLSVLRWYFVHSRILMYHIYCCISLYISCLYFMYHSNKIQSVVIYRSSKK